jgi:hypothetical protein
MDAHRTTFALHLRFESITSKLRWNQPRLASWPHPSTLDRFQVLSIWVSPTQIFEHSLIKGDSKVTNRVAYVWLKVVPNAAHPTTVRQATCTVRGRSSQVSFFKRVRITREGRR